MPHLRQLAILSTDFKPMVGGVADHLHRLADAMADTMPVTVFTSAAQRGAQWPHAYVLRELPPVPVRATEAPGDGLPPLRKVRTAAYLLKLQAYGRRTIAQVAQASGDDAAVVIGIWDMAGHAWCAACRRQNIPYHLLAHGAEIVMPLPAPLAEWRAVDFRAAAGIVANSTATAHLTADRMKLSRTPEIVRPSVGPRPDSTAIIGRTSALRGELSLHEGQTVFSLGRLVRRKGFDVTLRAIASLAAEFPRLSYVLVGDGPERAALESLACDLGLAGRVHFLGAVDELTKWAAYGACDVFVMPNRLLEGADWEGFGIVFLEAALAGRPSIAGRTGGVADAVVQNVTGILVDPESPSELSDALATLLRDGALRARLGEAGRLRAQTQFTPAASVERLRAALLLDPHGPSSVADTTGKDTQDERAAV